MKDYEGIREVVRRRLREVAVDLILRTENEATDSTKILYKLTKMLKLTDPQGGR